MGLPGAKSLRRKQAVTAALPGVPIAPVYSQDPSTFPIATPWSSSALEEILVSDVFPDGVPTNSRSSAMRVPAIARARNLLCSLISRMPLRVATVDGLLPPEDQPRWLHRTDGQSPRQRLAWTVDDLIFYGWSCWWVTRGEDGFPLHAPQRLNMGTWYIDADNRVVVNGVPVKPDANGRWPVILIPGFHEGILNFGRDAIADTKALYEIVRDRLNNPVAVTELHQTGGRDLLDTERDALLDHWRTARRKTGGTVGYTSKDIELKTHGGEGDATMLIEARNAAAVDMARMVGVAAGRIDATSPKASLNYETRTGRNQELVDFDLDVYAGPIEDRLSQDDVVPRTKHVVFDRGDTTAPVPSPTGPILQD